MLSPNTYPKSWVNVHEGYCMSTKGLLKKVKVKVASQKVTLKLKLKTCLATHDFWNILHEDFDGDSHLTL